MRTRTRRIKVGDLTLTVRPLTQAERDRLMPPRRIGRTEKLCRAIDAARQAELCEDIERRRRREAQR